MVNCQKKIKSNPFRMRPNTTNSPDSSILQAMLLIPALGEAKSKLLLEKFKSLHGIANASQKSLESVVGASSALSVYNYFNKC